MVNLFPREVNLFPRELIESTTKDFPNAKPKLYQRPDPRPKTRGAKGLDLECTDLTVGFPRFFNSGPLGEIFAPLENQSLTDCGKALGDI